MYAFMLWVQLQIFVLKVVLVYYSDKKISFRKQIMFRRTESIRSPIRSQSLCRDGPQTSVKSPPTSLQLYSLPDFNLTQRNMGK